jgi:hypothetical protein
LAHCLFVAVEESQIKTQQYVFRNVQFAPERLIHSALRLVEAVEIKITESNIDVPGSEIRIERNRFFCFLNGLFVPADALRIKT